MHLVMMHLVVAVIIVFGAACCTPKSLFWHPVGVRRLARVCVPVLHLTI